MPSAFVTAFFLIKTKIPLIMLLFRTLFSWRGKMKLFFCCFHLRKKRRKFCAVVQLFWNIYNFFLFSSSPFLWMYKSTPNNINRMTFLVFFFVASTLRLLLLLPYRFLPVFPIFSLSRFFSFQIHQCHWRTIVFFFLGSLARFFNLYFSSVLAVCVHVCSKLYNSESFLWAESCQRWNRWAQRTSRWRWL